MQRVRELRHFFMANSSSMRQNSLCIKCSENTKIIFLLSAMHWAICSMMGIPGIKSRECQHRLYDEGLLCIVSSGYRIFCNTKSLVSSWALMNASYVNPLSVQNSMPIWRLQIWTESSYFKHVKSLHSGSSVYCSCVVWPCFLLNTSTVLTATAITTRIPIWSWEPSCFSSVCWSGKLLLTICNRNLMYWFRYHVNGSLYYRFLAHHLDSVLLWWNWNQYRSDKGQYCFYWNQK